MKTLDTSLLCLEIKSVAGGYLALNLLTSSAKLRILEASPAGDRFLILASGDSSDARAGFESVRNSLTSTEIVDSEVIETAMSEFLNSLYSLSANVIGESLLIADCASVSALTALYRPLTEDGSTVAIELKVRRASPGGAFGFFTGRRAEVAAAAEKARRALQISGRSARIEVIDSPTQTFREFFNFSGKA